MVPWLHEKLYKPSYINNYVIPGSIDFTILTIRLQGGVTGHPWCGNGQAGGDGKAGSFKGWPSVIPDEPPRSLLELILSLCVKLWNQRWNTLQLIALAVVGYHHNVINFVCFSQVTILIRSVWSKVCTAILGMISHTYHQTCCNDTSIIITQWVLQY